MAASKKGSAINLIFVAFIVGAILCAAFTGKMKEVTDASFEAAKSSVTLAIGLVGIMALWLGLVRILEAGGFMYVLARWLKPLMVRLFPDVPAEHPAMGAMILNMSSNMLGLGNAATPFGIKAMVELDRLNPFRGTATNAMCLFLAINTSSVALLPLGVIGVRAAAGSAAPASIWIPTLIATISSTVVGVIVAIALAKRDRQYTREAREANLAAREEGEKTTGEKTTGEKTTTEQTELPTYEHLLTQSGSWQRIGAWSFMLLFIAAFFYRLFLAGPGEIRDFLVNEFITYWLMPGLMLLIVSYGVGRGVKVYDAVTDGAKQGFDIAVRIIPFLVAILVAIAMFRASGAMQILESVLGPITSLIGMPVEVLPMAIVRPLSGSGAFGVMSSIIERAPDSYDAFVASVMMGSTETTFYVLAVYFGAIGVMRIRHALVAALLADLTGIVVSCFAAQAFWRG